MAPDLDGKLAAEVSLETAGAGDTESLLAMMRDFNAGEEITVDEERLRPALARLLTDATLGRVWLIRFAGEVQGYAVVTLGYDLEFAGHDAFITELFLRPPARGRGIGRVALAQIEAATGALGAHALHLMVRPENSAAVALYAAAGFTSPPRTFLSKVLVRSASRTP
jgi:ribosomal protein S18 acetylase RimI-like enzyme